MKNIHNELQDIIIRNGRVSPTGKLEKTQNFLRGNASSGLRAETQKSIKAEEAFCLIDFARRERIFSIPGRFHRKHLSHPGLNSGFIATMITMLSRSMTVFFMKIG
ncbi:hypothetical protein [Leadbetterella sp. DM7]|uniref:hypothetical protein n=1 Tax=Leadbetterella sp. DM7 TaxID=3235085 RepID=UPI00349ED6BD